MKINKMEYEILFLKSLLLTIIIETIALFVIFKFFTTKFKINNYTLLFTGILATFATLPYLWFIFPVIFKTNVWYHFSSETFAVLTESLIIMGLLRINYKESIIISFICNMSSYIIGLIIT